ncbi:MAG: hypothetical protein C0468_07490 [Planctomyces sp.]|nr:hypothetical protein [Planctomyces sp.]
MLSRGTRRRRPGLLSRGPVPIYHRPSNGQTLIEPARSRLATTERPVADSFDIRLITPQGKVMDTKATYAVLPAHDGQIGVMHGQSPLVMRLGLGELRVDVAPTGGQGAGPAGSRYFVIEGGFAQVLNNRLSILTTRAASAETLSVPEATKELAAAREARPATLAQADKNTLDQERARVKLRLAAQHGGKL